MADYVLNCKDAGYALLDVVLTNEELASIEKDEAIERVFDNATLIDQFLIFIWEKIVCLAGAKKIFIIAADDACYAVLRLLCTRNLEESALSGIALILPDSQPVALPRENALWIYEVIYLCFNF